MQSRVITERRKGKDGKIVESKRTVFGGSELNKILTEPILSLSEEEKKEAEEIIKRLRIDMPTRYEMMSGETLSRDRSSVKKHLDWEQKNMSDIMRYTHLRERDESLLAIETLRKEK